MLTLERDSWVVKLAWFPDEPPPDLHRISGCVLFWRMVGGALTAVTVVPFFFVVFCIVGAVLYTIGFFFARKPDMRGPLLFVRYEQWPTMCGRQVWPITTIIIAALLYGVWNGGNILIANWTEISSSIWNGGTAFWVGLTILVGLATFGLIKFILSDAGKVTGEWLRAKKEKVCPMIQIVDRE